MKSIDCGATKAPVVPPSEIVSGVKPPPMENFQFRSRAVTVCSPFISAPQGPHVTYENSGLRIASGSLRPIAGKPLPGTQLVVRSVDGSAEGTSNERALSSANCGSQERTQRRLLLLVGSGGAATTWFKNPMLCCPTATHSPPARTLSAAWLWKQHEMSLRKVGLFALPGSTERLFVVSSCVKPPKRPTTKWSV